MVWVWALSEIVHRDAAVSLAPINFQSQDYAAFWSLSFKEYIVELMLHRLSLPAYNTMVKASLFVWRSDFQIYHSRMTSPLPYDVIHDHFHGHSLQDLVLPSLDMGDAIMDDDGVSDAEALSAPAIRGGLSPAAARLFRVYRTMASLLDRRGYMVPKGEWYSIVSQVVVPFTDMRSPVAAFELLKFLRAPCFSAT
jgi:RNA polymerase Rpb5, N-terminal domain